ncbi:Uncharacterised protein [Chlamydia trachomatis]|nr:Uncharacterised protein [Chlamydia trachomatis]
MIQEYIEDKANVYTNNEIDIIDYDENHTIISISLLVYTLALSSIYS